MKAPLRASARGYAGAGGGDTNLNDSGAPPGASRISILRAIWGVILAFVIAGTLMPGNSAPMRALASLDLSDKFEHFAAYFVLAVIPAIAERIRVRFAIAVGLIAMGVLLEYLQLFTGRDFEVGDMVADAIGVALGMIAGFAWEALRRRSAV